MLEIRFDFERLRHMERPPDDEAYLVDCIILRVTAEADELKAFWNFLFDPLPLTIVLRPFHSDALHVDSITVYEPDRLDSEVFCFIHKDLDPPNFVKWIKFSFLPFLWRFDLSLNDSG